MKKTSYLAAALLASSSISLSAYANTPEESKFNISGFATVAYAKGIDLEDEEVPPQAVSGIYKNSGEYRDFNKLGLRLDVELEDNLSFAGQLLADGVKDYKPEIDWLYINYQASTYLDVKVGRTRIPLFYYSDYIDVGYAMPWITAPSSVYGDGPFKTMEGVNFKYSRPLGPLDSEIQIYAGSTDEEIVLPNYELNLKQENITGISWAVGYEWLEFRASYFKSKSTGSNEDFDTLFTTLFDPVYGLGAVLGGDYVDDLIWEEDEPTFMGLGINMDFGDYFILSEATQVRNGDNVVVADVNSYYVTFGTRIIEDWTFALTYSRNDDELSDSVIKALEEYSAQAFGAAPGGFSPAVAAAIGAAPAEYQAGLSQAVYALPFTAQAAESESDGYAFNVRWDFHPQADLKFEYLYEKQTRFEAEDSLNGNAFRIALDLVF